MLGAFTRERPALTLSDIARTVEVPLSTAHRLVAELCAWGALERDDDGRYRIGPARLGARRPGAARAGAARGGAAVHGGPLRGDPRERAAGGARRDRGGVRRALRRPRRGVGLHPGRRPVRARARPASASCSWRTPPWRCRSGCWPGRCSGTRPTRSPSRGSCGACSPRSAAAAWRSATGRSPPTRCRSPRRSRRAGAVVAALSIVVRGSSPAAVRSLTPGVRAAARGISRTLDRTAGPRFRPAENRRRRTATYSAPPQPGHGGVPARATVTPDGRTEGARCRRDEGERHGTARRTAPGRARSGPAPGPTAPAARTTPWSRPPATRSAPSARPPRPTSAPRRARAVEAQRGWAALPFEERAAVLRKAGDVLEAHADEIKGWLARESGAIQPFGDFQVHTSARRSATRPPRCPATPTASCCAAARRG